MLKWLQVEWYNNRYDGVRSFIDADCLTVKKDTLLIKTLFYIERHSILSKLNLDNISWHYACFNKNDLLQTMRINGGGWDREFEKLYNPIEIRDAMLNYEFLKLVNDDYPHAKKIFEIYVSLGKRDVPNTLIFLKLKKSPSVYKLLEGNHRLISFLMAEKMYHNYLCPLDGTIIGIEN